MKNLKIFDYNLVCGRMEDILDWLVFVDAEVEDPGVKTCLHSTREHLLRATTCLMRARDLTYKNRGS